VETEPNSLQLLQSEQWTKFIERQCLKIAYYVKRIHNVEILQMKTEFLQDENQNIWLSSIRDIHIRRHHKRATREQ